MRTVQQFLYYLYLFTTRCCDGSILKLEMKIQILGKIRTARVIEETEVIYGEYGF